MDSRKTDFTRKNIFSIGIGFGAVWLIMTGMLVLALVRMTVVIDRMETISSEHSVKTALVSEMREAIRARQLLIREAFMSDDLFVRDELRLRFYSAASTYMNSRSKLLKLPLNDHEERVLDEIDGAAKEAQPVQNELVELSMGGGSPYHHEQKIQAAFHFQNNVLTKLDSFVAYQKKQTHTAVEEALDSYDSTRFLVIILASIAALLNLIIALQVARHNRSQTKKIEDLAKFPSESPRPVMRVSHNGDILYANVASYPLLGEMGVDPSGKVPDGWFRIIEQAIKSGEVSDFEVECKEKIFNIVVAPVANTEYVNLYGHDVTEREQLKRFMAHQACHDALTGLYNRREFEIRLEDARQNVKHTNNVHALLYLDLDQFKVVNDTCGHIAGDEMLKQISNQIKSKTRTSDILARLGGDEFGLLLNNCKVEKAKELAESLRKEIKSFQFCWKNSCFRVGASIGLVMITRESGDLTEILSAADSACYVAKDKGRNVVHVYSESDGEVMQRSGEMQWIPRIQEALEKDLFVLYRQDIVPLKKTKEYGRHCEILVRMRDIKKNRIIPPSTFIAAAERYSMMPAIDRWVVKNALKAISMEDKSNCDKYSSCSINLSGHTISDESFQQFVLDKIKEVGVDPRRICFEITETAVISNMTQAVMFMDKLRDMGCSFALDDFGSGMSSFSYLSSLNVDYIKIDGAYIKNVLNDKVQRAMVEAISKVAHEMGIKTVAEWVENEETIELLKEMGIDYAQGYALGRPRPFYEPEEGESELHNIAEQKS